MKQEFSESTKQRSKTNYNMDDTGSPERASQQIDEPDYAISKSHNSASKVTNTHTIGSRNLGAHDPKRNGTNENTSTTLSKTPTSEQAIVAAAGAAGIPLTMFSPMFLKRSSDSRFCFAKRTSMDPKKENFEIYIPQNIQEILER